VAERATYRKMSMSRIGISKFTAVLGLLICVSLAIAAGPGAKEASAKSQIFGYSSHPTTAQAGGHPDIYSEFSLGTRFNQQPIPPCGCNDPKNVILHTPPGVIANPHVAAICTAAEASLFECSADSQVGLIVLRLGTAYGVIPVYRTTPASDQAGLFVFLAPLGFPIPQYIAFNARTDSDFGLDVETLGISHLIPFDYYAPIIWGVPGAHSHDIFRFRPGEQYLGCFSNPVPSMEEGVLTGSCLLYKHTESGEFEKEPVATSIPIRPLIQSPTTCVGPLESSMETLAYDREYDYAQQPWPATTGCDQLSFNPSLSANPTTQVTDTASGLDVNLLAPQFQDPSTPSPSELRSGVVTLPEGFSINPNAADGKVVCSDAEARLGTREAAQCPEFSKVGTVTLDSSALPEPIPGAIYLGESKPGDRYRLILTAFGFGTAIKIPGSVRPNPTNGQLTVAFEDLPQAPFQGFDMHFFGSERGLLATPEKCGKYPVHSVFTPWDGALSTQSTTQFFVLDSAPRGLPCPEPNRPFAPSLEAGVEDNTAGAHTPFSIRLSRSDGDQNWSRIEVRTPPGFTARLKGVPYCPESALAKLGQPGYTGQLERVSPACPAATLVGSAETSEGAGTKPLFTQGKVYLAGPYKGAPLSLMVVVPAVSGPYDLGNVAVRVALDVDPGSAEITAISDPLPQILDGIPLRLRSIRLKIDRPDFVLNPTNCDPFAVGTTSKGSEGGTSTTSVPFQVANCADLSYAPKLALRLSGGIQRRGHPVIRATFTAAPGEANTRGVSVTLPKGEQLDSEHLDTVCTRVAFAAGDCPAGSVIGRAEASSPLLDQPLTGSVYLRSSDHQLPDMVLDLRGQVNIEVSAQVDSVDGRLRTTFKDVPDVPISKLVLNLAGGKKGLLINSEPLCVAKKKATVKTTGQNGVVHRSKSPLQTSCGSRAKRKRHSAKRTAG
jgi:hypothetical protein